jgi:anti-sigma factor RsiW
MSQEQDQRRDRLVTSAADTFATHLAECDECHANAASVARVEELLAAAPQPVIDTTALSQRLLAVARPELARFVAPPYWQRVAAAVLGGLLPLPFVVVVNVLFLAVFHALLTAAGLATVAAYLVMSYAALLALIIGATYAAVPVLVERSAGARPALLARG